MVTRKSTVRLAVEHLENRNVPAALLHVTAAQLAAIHDAAGISDGVADPGQPVSLPVADAVLVMPLPSGQQWFSAGNNQLAVTIRAGLLEDAWCGVTEEMAQTLADSLAVPLLSPVADADQPGTLPVTPELVELLATAEPGQPMPTEWLAAQLGVDPLALTATGEPLQLAVAVEGGFTVHTLTLDRGMWTLEASVFAETLTAGMWELRIAE